MRHVAVLAQPTGWLHNVACGIMNNTSWLYHACLRVNGHVVVHLAAIGIVRTLLIIAEEIDARCKEVDSRSLEELVTAATTFFLSLLQRLQQSLCRFTRFAVICR